jgi:hypothetical protein
MKSANEGSTISKDIKGKINLKETPVPRVVVEGHRAAQGRRLLQEGSR